MIFIYIGRSDWFFKNGTNCGMSSQYRDDEDTIWQIDIIHIEEGSRYDGYFERMADRIGEIVSPPKSLSLSVPKQN